jgi:hypothetical protein
MANADREVLSFEGYTLDLARGSVRNANGEIELRPKSFELLRYLVANAGRLVSKDELVNAVWPDVIVSDDSLAQCVSDVRRALNDADRRIIKTVPRRGAVCCLGVSCSAPSAFGGVCRLLRRCRSGPLGKVSLSSLRLPSTRPPGRDPSQPLSRRRCGRISH